MASTDTVFAGSIPRMYERYMVPMLFEPYAAVMAERAKSLGPSRILETAAGTGVVSRALHAAIPEAQIVATDLNEPMLEQALDRLRSEKVQFLQADALDLPFEDGSFDLAVCQFGVMFFPDKVRGNSEARRVLREGGRYMLFTWDRVDRNVATHAAGRAVAELFPTDNEAFYERVPFRYHDPDAIRADLLAAGFDQVDIERVELQSRAASARDAALGLVQGTPMRSEIESRGPDMLRAATDAATEALKQFEDPDGFSAPMSALLVTATR
jgi:ubiquinone/menaquinone biosynthesis C-methylase UbiE